MKTMSSNAAKSTQTAKPENLTAQPSMTIVKEEKLEEASRKLTIDERIQKVEDLTLLIERLRNLTDSRRKLASFQLGADAMSSTLQIRDASGNTFSTSNSAVIAEVLVLAKNTLDDRIRDVEAQITF